MSAGGLAEPPRLDLAAPAAVGVGTPAALVATPSQGLGAGERVEWTLIENAAGSGRLRLAGAVGGDGTRVTAHGLTPGVVTVRAAVRDARGHVRLQSDPVSITVIEVAATVVGAPWTAGSVVSVPVRVRPRGAPVASIAVALRDAAGAVLGSANASAVALQPDSGDATADVATLTLAVPAGTASPLAASVVVQVVLGAGGAATHAAPVRIHPPASPLLSVAVSATTLSSIPGGTVAVPIILATSQPGATTLAASWGPATTPVDLTAQLAGLAPVGGGRFQGTVTLPVPASAGRYALALTAAVGIERADASVTVVVAPSPLPGTALAFDAVSVSARQGEVFEHRFSLAPGLMAALTAPLAWRLVDAGGTVVCRGALPLPAASAASAACRGAVRFRVPQRLGRQTRTFRLELSGTLPDGTQILDSASVSIAGEPTGPLAVTIIEPAADTSAIEGTELHVGFTLGPLAATGTVEGVMVTLSDAGTGAMLVGQSVPASALTVAGDGLFGTTLVPILPGFSGADGGTGRTVLTVAAIEGGIGTASDTVGVTVFAAPTLSVVSPSPLTLREGSAGTVTVAIAPEVVTVTSLGFKLETSDGSQTLASGTLPGSAFTVVGGTVQASFAVTPPAGSASLSASVGTQLVLTAIVQESQAPLTLTTAVTILPPGPTILSITPSFGMPGTTITIAGSGFDATPGATTVAFTSRTDPDVAVTLAPTTANASGTSLTVVLSGGVRSGLNDVVVTVASVSSAPATYLVTTYDGLISTSGIMDRLRAALANTSAADSRNAIHSALNALGGIEALWSQDRWQRGFAELLVAESALSAAAAGGDPILVLLYDEFVRFMLDVTIAVLEFWRQVEVETGLSFPLTDGTSVQQQITTLTTLRNKLTQGQVTIPEVVKQLQLTTATLDEPPIEQACCGAAREILFPPPCACPKDRAVMTAMGAPPNLPMLHTFFLLPLPMPKPGEYQGSDAQKQGAAFGKAAAAAKATGDAYGTGNAQTATQAAGAEMNAENDAMAGYADFAFNNMLPPTTPPETRQKIKDKMEECKKKKGKPWEYNECLAELMQMLADALPKPRSRFQHSQLTGATVTNTFIAGDRGEIGIPVAIYSTTVCGKGRKAIGFAGLFVVQEPIEPISTSQGGEEAGAETPNTYCVDPSDTSGKTSVDFEVEVIPFACDPDKITWEAPSGEPATGKGTSFSSKFPAGRFEVSVFCGASPPIRIKVHIIGEFMSLTAETNAVCVGERASLDVRAVKCEVDKKGNHKAVNVSRQVTFTAAGTGKVDIKVDPKTGAAQVTGKQAGTVTVVATVGGQSDEIDLDVLGSGTVAIVPSHGVVCRGHWMDFDVISFDDECKPALHDATWSLEFRGAGRGGISKFGEFVGTGVSGASGDILVKATIQSGTGTPVVVTPAAATVLGVAGLSPTNVFQCLPASGKVNVAFSAKTTPLDRPNKLRWKVLPATASPSAAQGNALATTFAALDRYTVRAFCGSASQQTFVDIVQVKLALPGGDVVFIEDTNLIPTYTPLPADVSVEGDAASPAIALSLRVTGGGNAFVTPQTTTLSPGQSQRVELFGRAASAARGDTFLQALDAGGICAAIPFTVVGIDKVEWDTVKAGSVRQSGVIDANNPASHGGGHRIFPGKETPNDQLDRARVEAVVTVMPPIGGVDVHVALADADDPTINTVVGQGLSAGAQHDDETRHRDNFEARAAQAPAGDLSVLARANGSSDASGEFRVTFGVSLHPGDNYRAVAAAGSAPHVQAVQPSATGDVRRLRTDASTTYPEGGSPRTAKTSALLAVWRILHLEVDSMGPVIVDTSSDETNVVRGEVDQILASPGLAAQVKLKNMRLRNPLATLADGSPAPGRFQNGALFLGPSPPSGQGGPVLLNLLRGNTGGDLVDLANQPPQGGALPTIPFTLTPPATAPAGTPSASGDVLAYNDPVFGANKFFVNVTQGTLAANQGGGTFTIAGITFPVDNQAGSVNPTANEVTIVNTPQQPAPPIPAQLWDDDIQNPDDQAMLPLHVSNQNTVYAKRYQDMLRKAHDRLRDAFVELPTVLVGQQRVPIADGAGNINNNGAAHAFVRNHTFATLGDPGYATVAGNVRNLSAATRVPQYWAVHVVFAFQGPAPPVTGGPTPIGVGDGDPDSEPELSGLTPGAGSSYPSSLVWVAVGVDIGRRLTVPPFGVVEVVTAHELGHQLGIDDMPQNDPAYRPGSLMAFPLGDRVFEPRDQVIIRSQSTSPGLRSLQK